MQFQFTDEEKEFIHRRIRLLIEAIKTVKSPTPMERSVFKMRDKFTANSGSVSLGKKERSALIYVLTYLKQQAGAFGEFDKTVNLIDNIIRKVE